MFELESLKDLFRHMQWADGEVWRAVHAAGPAAEDERLRGLLLHLHTVQRAFLAVWHGRPVIIPEISQFSSMQQVEDWIAPYYAQVIGFLDSLDNSSLATPVIMPWAAELTRQLGMTPGTPTLGETIFQVTSHSTYHRGQVNVRLREVGGEPPLVDYIAWIWFGRPASGSPLAS